MSLTTLIDADQVQQRVREIADEIRNDYGDEPILIVGVLKGSFMFVSDLCRHLGDQTTIDFVQVSSYGNGTESNGNVQIRKDLDININGLNVLIVEDIVDSGATLHHLLDMLQTRNPRSLKVATLLSKTEARQINVQVDYIGFEIPNKFVVGYGLDLAEKYRGLTYIAVLQLD